MDKKKTIPDYLAESAIELISRKDLDRVSVRDICDNCGVSTRSFYNYFKDKNDLVQWIYFKYLEDFYQKNKQDITFSSLMTETGDILWLHKGFFQNLIKYNGQNSFKETCFAPLFSYYRRIIEDKYGCQFTEKMSGELTFFVLGMIEYVSRSFLSGNPQPVPEAIQIFSNSIPEELKKFL